MCWVCNLWQRTDLWFHKPHLGLAREAYVSHASQHVIVNKLVFLNVGTNGFLISIRLSLWEVPCVSHDKKQLILKITCDKIWNIPSLRYQRRTSSLPCFVFSMLLLGKITKARKVLFANRHGKCNGLLFLGKYYKQNLVTNVIFQLQMRTTFTGCHPTPDIDMWLTTTLSGKDSLMKSGLPDPLPYLCHIQYPCQTTYETSLQRQKLLKKLNARRLKTDTIKHGLMEWKGS